MSDHLPSTLLEFIRASVPSFQAAEALLFFATNRDRDFSAEEIVVGMRPRLITVAAVRDYAALFAARRLVTETNGRFRFDPASPDLMRAVSELSAAYNERPVTMITAIYQAVDGGAPFVRRLVQIEKD
jgi:hypothetical protein